MFKIKYIMKFSKCYYGGIYCGECIISDRLNAKKFDTKKELISELNSYEWIADDLEGREITIVEIVEVSN